MSENDSRATSHSFECVEDQVTCVEFSPFEASSHLIAYGGYSRISVGMCRFQVKSASVVLARLRALFNYFFVNLIYNYNQKSKSSYSSS